MLTLNGIDFGKIFCATGARGFYGEGYPFHKLWPWKHALKQLKEGAGFSGKTLTLNPRYGNMPLKADGVTPQEMMPDCIWTSFRNGGEMMNAVGLSNLGAEFYFQTGNYHRIDKPFFISFMTLAEDVSGREAELRAFCELFRRFFPSNAQNTKVALQINFGCPNSEHDLHEFYGEICTLIEIAKSMLGSVPIVANVNALMPTPVLIEVARVADALWIGNTIPFHDQATEGKIDWSRYGERSPVREQLDPIRWEFDLKNRKIIPVEKRKKDKIDGGLSSPVCLPFTIEKVLSLRDSGVSLPIIGGNGIRNTEDLTKLRRAHCDAVFIGSMAVVRPGCVEEVIDRAQFIF